MKIFDNKLQLNLMRKSLLIKNCESFSSNKNKTKKSQNICRIFSLRLVLLFLFVMTGVSSLAYIFQINQLATMGQEINIKEEILEELEEKNKALKIEVAQLKSSYHFENERERLALVNPEQVSFVEIEKNDSVAMIK